MRKVFSFGINSYPSCPLRGCVNDVEHLRKRLVDVDGVKDSEIRLLLDDRATTDAIHERLDWLFAEPRPGDHLILHNSSHGTLMAPRNAAGEVTDLVCAVCPVDFDFTPEHALTVDDFARYFACVPDGCRVTWIADSCHSARLLERDITCPWSNEEYRQPRSFTVPPDYYQHYREAAERGLQVRGFAAAAPNAVLLAGCAKDGTSADACFVTPEHPEGEYAGAFTTAFLAVLADHPGHPLGPLVTDEAHTWLETHGYSQDPHVQGGEAGATWKEQVG